MRYSKEALQEALFEVIRVVMIAIIPVIIISLENKSLDIKYIGVVAGIALLRFIDKWLHEIGKENNNIFFTKGLTRF